MASVIVPGAPVLVFAHMALLPQQPLQQPVRLEQSCHGTGPPAGRGPGHRPKGVPTLRASSVGRSNSALGGPPEPQGEALGAPSARPAGTTASVSVAMLLMMWVGRCFPVRMPSAWMIRSVVGVVLHQVNSEVVEGPDPRFFKAPGVERERDEPAREAALASRQAHKELEEATFPGRSGPRTQTQAKAQHGSNRAVPRTPSAFAAGRQRSPMVVCAEVGVAPPALRRSRQPAPRFFKPHPPLLRVDVPLSPIRSCRCPMTQAKVHVPITSANAIGILSTFVAATVQCRPTHPPATCPFPKPRLSSKGGTSTGIKLLAPI